MSSRSTTTLRKNNTEEMHSVEDDDDFLDDYEPEDKFRRSGRDGSAGVVGGHNYRENLSRNSFL